jgi:hypothetical protein
MRKIGFVLAVALVAIALPLAAQADQATNQSVNVTGWNDLGPNPTADVHGTASLIRRDNGISMTFRTSGLPANQPVTIWWIIVDPATGNVVSAQFADGHIVGGNGVASFAGSLAVGDTSGCFHPAFPCAGLTDSKGQVVLLLARVHGEKDPGRIPDQIHTSEATSLVAADDLCPLLVDGSRPFCQVQAALFTPVS